MLKIRQIKPQDAPLVADLIRKSPGRGYLNPKEKTELYWKTSVYKPNYPPSYKTLRRTRFLEKMVSKKALRKNYLVIEENNKIVGVVQKGGTSKFANLYLDERYSRTGKANQIISYVENNLTKKLGTQVTLKPPVSPSTILIKKPNQKPISSKPIGPIKLIPFKINK